MAAFWAFCALLLAIPPLRVSVCHEHTRHAAASTAAVSVTQRGVEDLADLAHPHELEIFAQVLGDVLEIPFVAAGREDAVDAGPLSGQRLLLQAADRQHLAGQRELAG